MNNLIKKISLIVLVLISTLVLTGCNVTDLFKASDPEIVNISTKEEAVAYLSEKIVEWNNLKISVSLLSFIQTPYSGYASIEEEKFIYLVDETDDEGNKSIKEYKYIEDYKLYSYKKGSDDEYKVYDANEHLSLPFTLEGIFEDLRNGTFDHENLTYTQDPAKIILNIKVSVQGKEYTAEITYKNDSIVCKVQDFANITLSKDKNNFFNDWVVDKTLFE